jgi:hypothetical protein
MREISLHLLDIAENSVSAGASNIEVRVLINDDRDILEAVIVDNGKGMSAETVAQVIDPFFTSRTTRKVGLGIPLLKAAAEACDGGLIVQSSPGIGTKIDVHFRYSHIDRMPLGDLSSTFVSLLVAYPDINWLFEYTSTSSNQGPTSRTFAFDNQSFKEALAGCPYSEPMVLEYIRELFENGIQEVENPLKLTNLP